MPLASMTGFARRDGRDGTRRWTWEVRSVNGKGLDIRLKLPPGYEFLEVGTRERVTARIARGNVQATFSMAEGAGTTRLRLNDAVLADVATALAALRTRIPDAAPPAHRKRCRRV